MKTMSRKKFIGCCFAFPVVIYALVILSFIMWSIYGDVVKSAYMIDGVYTYYSGEPILSPASIFLYITVENSLLIGTIFLLLAISVIRKNEKMINFLLNVNIWSYITVAYILLNFAVLFYDIGTGFRAYVETIEKFGFSIITISILASRLVLHHVLFLYYFWLLKYIKPLTPVEKNENTSCVVIGVYYILWYIVINIIGYTAFGEYRWFPYVMVVPEGFYQIFSITTINVWMRIIFYGFMIIALLSIIVLFKVIKMLFTRRYKK